MDRMQIAFKLGLDILGIPVNVQNYRVICNAVYIAKQRGIHLSPRRLTFDKNRGLAYSPLSHTDGGNPYWNLYDDIVQIQQEIGTEIDDSHLWTIDQQSRKKLQHLKEDITIKGIEKLLKN